MPAPVSPTFVATTTVLSGRPSESGTERQEEIDS
jgi:hypothetical protein